jgi:hypothetical protein
MAPWTRTIRVPTPGSGLELGGTPVAASPTRLLQTLGILHARRPE